MYPIMSRSATLGSGRARALKFWFANLTFFAITVISSLVITT